MRILLALLFLALSATAVDLEHNKLNAETLEHFSKPRSIDTSSPPGNESFAVDYPGSKK